MAKTGDAGCSGGSGGCGARLRYGMLAGVAVGTGCIARHSRPKMVLLLPCHIGIKVMIGCDRQLLLRRRVSCVGMGLKLGIGCCKWRVHKRVSIWKRSTCLVGGKVTLCCGW